MDEELPRSYWRCHLCDAHADEFLAKPEAKRELTEHLNEEHGLDGRVE